MSVGAVDIGTNSMRLLVLDDQGSTVERTVEVTGLGTGLDRSGRLQDEPMEATLSVLEGFGERLRGCRAVRVVATAATREADNGAAFVERAETVLGHRPEVISATDEARLAYDGALAALDPPVGSIPVVVDIGGGSTEFVTARNVVSDRIGSVRLTDRRLPERPVSFGELEAAAEDASRSVTVQPSQHSNHWLVGVAGTWTSLAALVRGEQVPGELHGSTIERTDVDRLVVRLASLTFEETARLPGLDPRRARVILAGAIIAREALRRYALPEATVSEHDLLDAVARSLL